MLVGRQTKKQQLPCQHHHAGGTVSNLRLQMTAAYAQLDRQK